MIVPTLCIGMPDRTLCVPVTRSVTRCVTTQRVGTIKTDRLAMVCSSTSVP
jgi:hypothetical protein